MKKAPTAGGGETPIVTTPDAPFKAIITATASDSELTDVFNTSAYINASKKGIILGVPIQTSGNAANDYTYTLTIPLIDVDSFATNYIRIWGYDGANFTVDLLKTVNVSFPATSYKIFKMVFTQITASLTDFTCTKTILNSTTYNLSPAQIIKVNGANLEIFFELTSSSANNDLKVRYYTLTLSKTISLTKFFNRYWKYWIIHSLRS